MAGFIDDALVRLDVVAAAKAAGVSLAMVQRLRESDPNFGSALVEVDESIRLAGSYAMRSKAAAGDPKAAKLLALGFGSDDAGDVPATQSLFELLAIARVTLPWFDTTVPPGDEAEWHFLRNRLRVLEAERAERWRTVCPHCKRYVFTQNDADLYGHKPVAGDDAPPEAKNAVYQCGACGTEGTVPATSEGWRCERCGGWFTEPVRRF